MERSEVDGASEASVFKSQAADVLNDVDRRTFGNGRLGGIWRRHQGRRDWAELSSRRGYRDRMIRGMGRGGL